MRKPLYNIDGYFQNTLNQPLVPAAVSQGMAKALPAYQAAAQQINQAPGFGTFLQGMAEGGIFGGISAKRKAKTDAALKLVELQNKFQGQGKALLDQQILLDKDVVGPRNYLQALQTQMDAVRASQKDKQGNSIGLPTGTPDLYNRNLGSIDGPQVNQDIPYIAPEQALSLFKSAVAPSDVSAQIQLMPGVANTAMNLFGQQGGNGGSTTFKAGASKHDIELPPVIADPQTLQNNLQQVFSSGLAQGANREKLPAEISKLEAEVKKLVAEGKVEEARQLLIQAQTKTEQQRPGLVQAQAGYYNRMPSVSASQPNHDAVMMGLYGAEGLKNAGYGLPHGSASDALTTFQLQSVIGDNSGKYTPEMKQAAQTALGRLGGFGTPSAGVARTPGVRPMSSAGIDYLRKRGIGGQ